MSTIKEIVELSDNIVLVELPLTDKKKILKIEHSSDKLEVENPLFAWVAVPQVFKSL